MTHHNTPGEPLSAAEPFHSTEVQFTASIAFQVSANLVIGHEDADALETAMRATLQDLMRATGKATEAVDPGVKGFQLRASLINGSAGFLSEGEPRHLSASMTTHEAVLGYSPGQQLSKQQYHVVRMGQLRAGVVQSEPWTYLCGDGQFHAAGGLVLERSMAFARLLELSRAMPGAALGVVPVNAVF